MKKVFSLFVAALFSVAMFATTEVLTFGDATAYGYTNPEAGAATNVPVGSTVSKGNVVLTSIAKGGSTENRFWNSNGTITFRMAKGGAQVSLKTIDGSKLTEVVVYGNAQIGQTLDQIGGTAVIASDNKSQTWTGEADSLLFESKAAGSTINFDSIKVTYVAAGPTPEPEYVIEGSVAGTLTAQGSLATGFSGSSINRGGFALGADGLYFCNNTTGHMSKMELDLSAINALNDSIGKGYYMDIDDAGNYVIWGWTGGSASIDVAQVYTSAGVWVRNDTIALNGRCDMPTIAGNVLAGRGAYFVACNSANTVLRFNVVDGVMAAEYDEVPTGIALGGNSSVAPLDVDHFYVQSRGNALIAVDMTTATPTVTNMSYFSANTFTSAYGGKAFKFAGHTLYVMGTYKVGGYLGSFAVFDVTDPAHVYQIAEEKTNAAASAMGTACVTFRVKVEGQTATIYEYAGFTVRKYTLTVSPACYLKQGNEGAEWQAMTAGENGFTLEGILAADSLFINGAAADAGATMIKLANATVNGTVAVNDTVRFTYNNGALTVDSLGHFIPVVTFNVVVPEATPSCYIAGTLNGWTFDRMVKLDDTHYTYTWRAEGANTTTVEYKYCAGAAWAYVEKSAAGEEIANRHWAAADTVATWLAVPTVNTITYELNGGVTNAYGWLSKAHMCLDLQADFNAAYNLSKAWAKEEDGIVYYYVNNAWKLPSEVEGSAADVASFIQNVTYNTDNQLVNLLATDKWKVVGDYINGLRVAAGFEAADEGAMRADLSGFFLNSPAITDYRHTNDYAVAGQADAFCSAMKMGFANPEQVIREVVLNNPYKEGYTFDGWFAAADFSGEKVLSVNENTTGTLYAKWIEYISTVAEAAAAADDAAVKVAGTVSMVAGAEFWIQDATGGLMCYQSNHGLAVGEAVRLAGTKVTYGGIPELKNITVVAHEAGTAIAPTAATIAQLKAKPADYMSKLVKLVGVNICAYDSYHNPTFTDNVDSIVAYKVSLDETAFPLDTKVNATLVLSAYNGKLQLRGVPEAVEAVAAAGRDPYTYTTYKEGENEYKLENAWLFSQKLDNFTENMPAGDQMARAMGVKNGIMYFPDRQNMQIVRVNGANGKMLEPVKLAANIFTETLYAGTDSAKTVATRATLLNNDLKFDNAGHMLLGVCVTSGTQTFQVWNVDETTGEGTCVLSDIIANHKAEMVDTVNVAKARFDYFGVYGDVTANAIIMASDQFTMNVYKWTIKNGVVTGVEDIDCKVAEGVEAYIAGVVATGTGPQVFPVDEDYFYVDGWNTIPTLFDMDGELAGDMKSNPLGNNVPMDGDTIQIGVGHNGICEFQVGEDYFVVMAATNTAASVPSAFALYKYADASKDFATMTPLWFFPQVGMGGASNGVRTAVPSVEVSGNVANIYVYTQMNGYGRYTLTCNVKTAVENIATDVKAEKIIENGQVYIIRNGVRYSVLGARVK